MAIDDLFSRRQRIEQGQMPDVFQYDELPHPFRVQVLHIVSDALGEETKYDNTYTLIAYRWASDAVKREHGLLQLAQPEYDDRRDVTKFFLAATTLQALDIIEVLFRAIKHLVGQKQYMGVTKSHRLTADEAVEDLNARFKESGIGYQFEGKKLVRLDSEFVHAEIVRPALAVLRDERYSGANEEFLAAHEHYRQARHEECIVSCCKSFESTMKAICTYKNWAFKPTATAQELIRACLDNGLMPAYSEQQLTSLRTLFESGIPTVRNKQGGHGQGVQVRVVTESLARYTLNQTATTILFMVESAHALDAS